MNERIRELDKQAYQWAVNESKDGPNICAPGSDYFLAMEKKKFAELIVQECLAIAKNREDELESAGLVEESNAVGNVAYRISRQFGVKR